MDDFEILLGLLLLAVALAAVARRVGAPYPAFLALGGAALAFVPGAPRFELSPDLALALFVAPVLVDAAYDASPRDLKDNWAPLTGLVVAAVSLTTLGVAWVTHTLEPEIPWAAAIALGAVVAPPDAAAATAVLRQVRPPHRIVTILEGESLLNDASALLLYRIAVGVVVAGGFTWHAVGPTFLLAIAGSVVAGLVGARLLLPVMARIEDPSSAVILQLSTSFGGWILAEKLHLSPVLYTVCFASSVARRAPAVTPARMRVPSYAVWDTVVFVANVLAFVLIGMQIRPIVEALSPDVRERYFVVAGAVLATVIVVRVAWVMGYNTVARGRIRKHGFHPPRPMMAPSVKSGLIISWCGMRGIVTLAAALALPSLPDGSPFPFRGLIVLVSFSVVLGTLVIQGLTLRPLLAKLDLRDDNPVGREMDVARARALTAVLELVGDDVSPKAEIMRHKYSVLFRQVGEGEGAPERPEDDVHTRAIVVARRVFLDMRSNAEIGDDAFHKLEEELDRVELGVVR